jgi:D-sedoheptulose 7-phosphate isomerase
MNKEKGKPRATEPTDAYRLAAAELKEILDRFFETRRAAFEAAAEAVASSLKGGGKVLVFGNGGSAAEAQHFAAELVNGMARRGGAAIAAVSLSADTSSLTAIGNDRGFAQVFGRQVDALGAPGDIALALTTSGVSPNIIEGLKAARTKGLVTIALTGEGGGVVGPLADHLLDVASRSTARVQEAHLVLLHLLAEELERRA